MIMKSIIRTLLIAACLASTFQLNSCSFFVTKPEAAMSGIVDADNPYIQYVGRFDFSNPKKVVFDWAGVYICAKFTGTSCSIRLADSTDEYAIIIDDHAPRLLTIDTSTVYRVASGLSDSIPHTIIIQKRTEPLVGTGTFMGFVLDKGATLLPPDRRPDRRIEFIGNSITSGYGVLGDSSNCHFSPHSEDAAMAYGAMTARELHADYHLVSYSGRGVVRNYGDKNKMSINPMPALYDRICYSDSIDRWDFRTWVPQSVVINLGTNDFSTQPYPDSSVFVDAYCRLIDTVRSLYPGVTIFCVTGPMIEEPCTHYVREAVKEEQQREGRDKDVFFIEIPRSMMSDTDWGCDLHPNVYGANKMADVVVRMLRLRMNW
jgi:Carbohydrate esterase 2 N-terminal/GDSL-like Lipase/Acylhydrolase family